MTPVPTSAPKIPDKGTSPNESTMSNRTDTIQLRYVAATSTLGLAAACWVVAVRQMVGMNMGIGSQLGSFGFFVLLWGSMMAAMMLPGAVPAVSRRCAGRRPISSSFRSF